MTTITTYWRTLDMQSWEYFGLDRSRLSVAASTPTVEVNSTFSVFDLVSVPDSLRYAHHLQLRGNGFGDFDPGPAHGLPRSGVVTGATLSANFGNVVAFDGLNLPVGEFLDLIASRDGERMRNALLGGDDEVHGGSVDIYLNPEGDRLLGLAGNDTLNGHGGHDTLKGGLGDDLIRTIDGVTASISQVDGGEGFDTLAYDQSPIAVVVDLASGAVGSDTFVSVERLLGSAFGDTLTGSAAADTLSGGGGGDSIAGLAGDDVFVGSDGATINGGDGLDTLTYSGRAVAVKAGLGSDAAPDSTTRVERLIGTAYGDELRGSAGSDTLIGGGGDDTIFAGESDDTIQVAAGLTFLRGEGGNDSISGGADFDYMNGNMGRDTVAAGAGDDWVLGGKDSDVISGDGGADLMNGNLGNDTCQGGAGNDTIRGGQEIDVLVGGGGDDVLSGDRGDDSVTGGTGADRFYIFQGAGTDRVTDFNRAEGDSVLLDPGTQYVTNQVGADTVIDIVGGGQMVLVGVQMSALSDGWIFGA